MKSKRYFDYEIFKNEFDKSQKDLEKRKAIRDLKDYIKGEYERQLKEGILDIEAERIRLEKNLGVYYHVANDKNNYFRTMGIFAITTMITTGLFQTIDILISNNYIKVLGKGIFILAFMYSIAQLDTDSKHYEKDFVNSLSLKVLKEIEGNRVK
ncbi:hypothetical protein [Clostridium sp.]|uniref:hypothetical protein n=1 Tax=Clostridium sp. TaxID=1506 RepID=UPI001ED44103|nr:hypothetical protein [Clostridium sp.]MBS5886206.1 hypothetical protein [Clostridium sp.]